MKTRFLLFTFFVFSIFAEAQFKLFVFDSTYSETYISDIRSTILRAEAGYINDLGSNYFVSNYTTDPFFKIDFGLDLPAFYYSKDRFQVSTVMHIASYFLIDMFEEKTSPVINNDYWFGPRIKFVYDIVGEERFFKNIVLDLIPIYHESTHIGDEFSIHGMDEVPGFYRVNVSYEAWEASFGFNEPERNNNEGFSAKLGLMNVVSQRDGFYQTDSIETMGQKVFPSKSNFEYYIMLNYEDKIGKSDFSWLVSIDLRNRLKYSYFREESKRFWSVNSYYGFKMNNNTRYNPGLFLRYYYGINPNGQFRNISDYYFVGISFALF